MATKPTDDDGWGDAADSGTGDAKTGTSSEPSGEPAATSPPSSASDDGWESPVSASDALADEAPAQAAPVAPTDAPTDAPTEAPASEPDPWGEEPDLAAIVGAPPTKKKTKPPRPPLFTPKQRRNLILGALAAALVAAYVVASWLNSGDLYLVCGENSVTAEKGSFFPWGRSALGGTKWRPVEVGDECAERTVADEPELEGVFLDMVLARANERLSANPATDLDRAAELLEQAQLLARHPSRGGARADIARLQNDVEYWRARTEVETALSALETAQGRLETAAGKTRHASDAGERADFLRKLIDIAKAGSFAEPDAAHPKTDRPVVPVPATPTPSDTDAGPAGSADLDAGAAPEPKELPVPAGGVLL